MSRSKKGFTIVELVIVIAVVAILAAVLIPSFSSLNKKAKDSAYLQERTNQQIADLAEKVENQDYLTWEDLEAKLAEEIAKIPATEPGASEDDVKTAVTKAISTALANFETSLKDNNTALTEAQVKAIVEKALEGQLTSAQVEGIVKAAVDGIKDTNGTDLTAEIKNIVDNAVAGLNKETGITKEEMTVAIEAALQGKAGLTEDQVKTIVTNALAGFGYGNDISAGQIKDIIENAMGGAKVTADELAIADMNNAVSGKSFAYAGDVVSALYSVGFNAGKLKPYTAGTYYAYDSVNNEFCVLDKNGSTDANLWGFFNNNTADKIPGVKNYIAIAPVTNVTAFNEIFVSGGKLDLNKTFIGIAGKADVTVQNGQMRADASFTNGGSVTTKALATTNYVTKDNGVYTVENVVMTSTASDVKNNAFNINDTNYGDATAIVFKNVTLDFTTNNVIANIIAEKTKAQSIVFDSCTILMGSNYFLIGGNDDYKPDVTIKNCYISSGAGFNFAGNSYSNETTYGNIVIENNTFVNGDYNGRPFVQFGGSSNTGNTFTAESITIKNNEFVCSDVAIRIHDSAHVIDCSSIAITGNKFSGTGEKIGGDNTDLSKTIAAEWAAKIK